MTEFTLGARVTCTDGFCGILRRTILDPAAGTLTHLVVEPGRHHQVGGRLVPVGLAEPAGDQIRLRCTLAEFGRLDPAEEVDLARDDYGGGYGAAEAVQGYGDVGGMGVGGSSSGLGIGMSLGQHPPMILSHSVPLGETEVERDEPVHATDGEIGRVEGFVVDPAHGQVTHVLLAEGHLWGRKHVAIPVSAVASVSAGIRLSISKQQVADLPPYDPAG
jgi:sporulation protein YlmC with PRC-barrel domain